jgi:hypothetical protein
MFVSNQYGKQKSPKIVQHNQHHCRAKTDTKPEIAQRYQFVENINSDNPKKTIPGEVIT